MSQEVQKSNGNAGEGELAQRSDSERSEGERSGASSPSPAAPAGREPGSPSMSQATRCGVSQPRGDGLDGPPPPTPLPRGAGDGADVFPDAKHDVHKDGAKKLLHRQLYHQC